MQQVLICNGLFPIGLGVLAFARCFPFMLLSCVVLACSSESRAASLSALLVSDGKVKPAFTSCRNVFRRFAALKATSLSIWATHCVAPLTLPALATSPRLVGTACDPGCCDSARRFLKKDIRFCPSLPFLVPASNLRFPAKRGGP